MAYLAIPTLLGQAALAAAVAGEAPLDLARMVIGDGNGNPTTPIETQTNLVNLRATLPLQEVTRKPEAPHRVNVEAILDVNTGGWTIREAGLVDSSGRLLFVASVPATEKRTLADNVEDELTLGVYIVVSAAANITIAIDEATWATQGFVETLIENWRVPLGQFLRVPFIAVDAIQSNPPSAPAVGATFLIGDNASGAWVGMDGRLVQWRGDKGWSFAIPPLGTTICVGSTGVYWKRVSTGWRRITADNDEHLAGTSTVLFATPAGVKAMIGNRFPANKAGALVNDGAGNFSWEERLPIRTLDTKASAASADRIPVYDPVLKDNRTVTISQVSAILADADEMHLEIMFQGML